MPAPGSPRFWAAARRAVGAEAWTDGSARPPRWIVGRWLSTRLLTMLILLPENNILGDVRYYARQVEALFGPPRVTVVLPEYPAPALAVFVPPWWAALGSRMMYLITFVLLMIAIDAAFTAALWRASGRRPTPGVRVWLLLVPCLGPLTFTRFDLVSAALAGAALLALAARRPVRSGLLAAAGAAVKLWPATLLPALLLHRDRPRRLLAGFAGLGLVALATTVAGGGTTRLLSPLTWQGQRGLQLETIWAVPLLWGRAVSPQTWSTPYTRFFAFQVEGPGAAALVTLSTVATVAALVLLGWLWWRAWRAGRRPDGSVRPASLSLVGLLAIAAACLLIVPNKTLSPQYLLWIGGLLAALGAVAPAEPVLPRLNLLIVLACVVTQVLYPLGYGMLTGPHWSNAIGAALLTARNGLLLAITVLAVRRVLVLTRGTPG
ncbi:MAG TPA: glycosyltransferase 87 family protein [Mycobacteriales bacterium]|nr:glycosyltransferase 87 family protein [Mycobacteriales bacterium]